MDISIIIPSYNTKKAISECIRSCLIERSKAKREIIVIDNASSDGSRKYLKERFGKNIILIENDQNLGFAKAVNQGLKISKGKYKYLLNSDTAITNGTFDKLIMFADSDGKIGVIGTKLVLPDGSIQKSCFNFPTIGNAIREYWFGEREKYSSFYKKNTSEVDSVVGASFFITPKAYEQVGIFDERYFMFYEDHDYCRRVKDLRMKVIYFPEVTVFHHHGLSGKDISSGQNQWRRLIPSSKVFNGVLKHYLINFILWSGQKFFVKKSPE